MTVTAKKFGEALIASGLLFLPLFGARAQEASHAQKLEALGGKVTSQGGHVTQLVFSDCSALGDAEFRAIGELTHLKTLTLYGNCRGLTDAAIRHLAGLKQLETLGTDGAQLTDDGLKHLAALTNLRALSFFHLSFRMEGFTGASFAQLQPCAKLEKLTVAGMSMGDEGFAAIATLTQLRDFSTWHTYQTEAGNAHIAKLSNLRALRIGQRLPRPGAKAPSLSDASLATFAALKNLETLQLGEAHFTFDALRTLKGLPNLRRLVFFETDLTAETVDRLRGELSAVKIEWQPLTAEQRKKFEMYLKQ